MQTWDEQCFSQNQLGPWRYIDALNMNRVAVRNDARNDYVVWR